MASVLTVVGARPQFIKAAPVSESLRQAGLTEILVHTGQHFDAQMSEVFFSELSIPAPDYNLDIHSVGHGAMTGRMLEKLEVIMLEIRPDLVLVYGDTNSTIAGGLAASKLHIPVAHVEAGLRSFNRRMPEEINRVIVDHLSALLFCPTESAVTNLAAEGIRAGVHAVGDVMYDSTVRAISIAREKSGILERLGLRPKTYAVATIHRAENTDDERQFADVLRWLERAAIEQTVVMPVHPRTWKLMESRARAPQGVVLVEPLGYLDMTWLAHNCAAIFTDSGGLQKEAYFHRVPCVTLRDETEWIETVDAGWNTLWRHEGNAVRREISDYGDGRAAAKIAQAIVKFVTSEQLSR